METRTKGKKEGGHFAEFLIKSNLRLQGLNSDRIFCVALKNIVLVLKYLSLDSSLV